MSDINPTKVVIDDIPCLAFGLVAHLSTGYFILGAEAGLVSSVDTKEGILNSFDFVIEKLKDNTDIVTRQQWDNANLICIHMPIDDQNLMSFTSPYIGAQSLYLDFGFMQQMGIPVTKEILKLRAFSLKEDIIAQVDLSRQEKTINVDLG